MRIIRPITLTDAMMTSSNVPDVDIIGTSTTSLLIEIASKTFTTQASLGFIAGEWVKAYSTANAANYMYGKVTSYATTQLVINVTVNGGAGTLADWKLSYGWDTGATYTGGDQVQISTPNIHKIYESLANTGLETLTLDVAPATAWVADRTLTGQTSNKTCKVVAKLTTLTYLVKERSGDFTLGEVIGVTGYATELADQGAAKPTFAIATNIAHDPPTDLLLDTPLWWKEVSATNRWKAFDNKVGSQTSQATSITYKITPGVVVDSIAFLNLDAAEVTIVSTDPIDGIVYNKTINLLTTVITGTTTVMDWYTYFFSSVVKITAFVKFDIPPYLNTVFDITISYPSETAKVGGIILGLQTNMGTTQAEPKPSFGTHDYSQKTVDDYGVYSVTAGAFSKRMTFTLLTPNSSIDEIERLLALYRATLIVWAASETFGSMILYGFCKDHDSNAGLNFTEVAYDIEGVT